MNGFAARDFCQWMVAAKSISCGGLVDISLIFGNPTGGPKRNRIYKQRCAPLYAYEILFHGVHLRFPHSQGT